MTIIHALIFSLVEGLTEFLPISSTGHLILTSNLLQIPATEFVKSFEIVIQLGAVMAVVGLYWQKLLTNTKLWLPLIVGFLPTAIVGMIAYPFIKQNLLGNTDVVLWSLALGGIVLLFIDKLIKGKQKSLTSLTWQNALLIGLFQSVAVIPGVSRAAATIIGGLVAGLDRKSAVEFSFFLAIPTMAAATGLDLIKSGWSFSGYEWLLLMVGFIGAFITALMAIKFFLSFVQKHEFKIFGIYRIIISALGAVVLQTG